MMSYLPRQNGSTVKSVLRARCHPTRGIPRAHRMTAAGCVNTRVARILAPAGTDVRQGDGVIVLEAMKMENELRAPRDGTVTSVDVEEGEGVERGTLLATIE